MKRRELICSIAVSGLAIPPDQNLFQSESTFKRRDGVSMSGLLVLLRRPVSTATGALHYEPPVVTQPLQHVAHHLPAHARTFGLNLGNGEGTVTAPHGSLDHVSLRPSSRPDRPHPLLELPVRPHQDAPQVAHPGQRIVLSSVPLM